MNNKLKYDEPGIDVTLNVLCNSSEKYMVTVSFGYRTVDNTSGDCSFQLNRTEDNIRPNMSVSFLVDLSKLPREGGEYCFRVYVNGRPGETQLYIDMYIAS